jgi:CRP-like cAMP-binding protein
MAPLDSLTITDVRPHCRPDFYESLATGGRELRGMFREGQPADFDEGDTLIEPEQATRSLYLLRRGWACRTRRLPDGSRSIIDIYLPGDLIGFDTALLHRTPDSVLMLTAGAAYALDANGTLPTLLATPRLALCLAWAVSEAQRRIETLASTIRRCDGAERIVMALVGFYLRLRRRQLVNGLSYSLPMTQRELGDYVGMTSIHVNRTLRSLREARMVVVEKGVVMMIDRDRLMRLAGARPGEAAIASEVVAGTASVFAT